MPDRKCNYLDERISEDLMTLECTYCGMSKFRTPEDPYPSLNHLHKLKPRIEKYRWCKELVDGEVCDMRAFYNYQGKSLCEAHVPEGLSYPDVTPVPWAPYRTDLTLTLEQCDVTAYDMWLEVSADGRKRGIWFSLRDKHREPQVNEGALMEWPKLEKVYKAIGKELRRMKRK